MATKPPNKQPLSIGMTVLVVRADKSVSDVPYRLDMIGEGQRCGIREIRADGKLGALQAFDLSLLTKAD